MLRSGLDSSGSVQEPLTGFSEHGNKGFDSMKFEGFFNQTSNYELLRASDSSSCFTSLLLPKSFCNKTIFPPPLLLPAVPGTRLCRTCAHVALYWATLLRDALRKRCISTSKARWRRVSFFRRALLKRVSFYIYVSYFVEIWRNVTMIMEKYCVRSIQYELSVLSLCW